MDAPLSLGRVRLLRRRPGPTHGDALHVQAEYALVVSHTVDGAAGPQVREAWRATVVRRWTPVLARLWSLGLLFELHCLPNEPLLELAHLKLKKSGDGAVADDAVEGRGGSRLRGIVVHGLTSLAASAASEWRPPHLLVLIHAPDATLASEALAEQLESWLAGVGNPAPLPGQRDPTATVSVSSSASSGASEHGHSGKRYSGADRRRIVHRLLESAHLVEEMGEVTPVVLDEQDDAHEPPEEEVVVSSSSSSLHAPTSPSSQQTPTSQRTTPSPRRVQFRVQRRLYPLHDRHFNRQWLPRWTTRWLIQQRDLDKLRDQYGEKVAFYFAFLVFYTLWMAPPALLGVASHVVRALCPSDACTARDGVSPAVTAGILLWTFLLPIFWTRRANELCYLWGVRDASRAEGVRGAFARAATRHRTDEVTGERVPYYPASRRLLKQLTVVPVFLGLVVTVTASVCGIFAAELLLTEFYTGPGHLVLKHLPTLLYVLLIPRLNHLYFGLSRRINDWEMYAKASTYEARLISKAVAFYILVSCVSLFFIGLVYIPYEPVMVRLVRDHLGWTSVAPPKLQGMGRMRTQLVYVLATNHVVTLLRESLLPLLTREAVDAAGRRWLRREPTGPAAATPSPRDRPRRHNRASTVTSYESDDDASDAARPGTDDASDTDVASSWRHQISSVIGLGRTAAALPPNERTHEVLRPSGRASALQVSVESLTTLLTEDAPPEEGELKTRGERRKRSLLLSLYNEGLLPGYDVHKVRARWETGTHTCRTTWSSPSSSRW